MTRNPPASRLKAGRAAWGARFPRGGGRRKLFHMSAGNRNHGKVLVKVAAALLGGMLVAGAMPALGSTGEAAALDPLQQALARCAAFTPATGVQVPAGRTLTYTTDTRIEQPSLVIDGTLTTGTLRNPEAGASAPRAADLCIVTERLTIGGEGTLSTGAGLDGTTLLEDATDATRGEDGGRGGDLIVVLRDDLNTPSLPALVRAVGALIATGDGGDGKDTFFEDIPFDLCYPIDRALGGDGGSAGLLDLYAPEYVLNGPHQDAFMLGKGGDGGDAMGLSFALGGRGGDSRARFDGREPDGFTASFVAASDGGAGGLAMAMPDFHVYEVCEACLPTYGGNPVTCIEAGDEGPDVKGCGDPQPTVSAQGNDGGYGIIRGGKGGDAVAVACPQTDLPYNPPNPGLCSPDRNGPKSENGGLGPSGYHASALGGNGGDSFYEGGPGGNSEATASPGIVGGTGAWGCDHFPVNVVCWIGGHGGDAGDGGRGGDATSYSGKGGHATVTDTYGAPGTFSGEPGAGGPPGGIGGPGSGVQNAVAPWPSPPYVVVVPCLFPNGDPGAPGDPGDTGNLNWGIRP